MKICMSVRSWTVRNSFHQSPIPHHHHHHIPQITPSSFSSNKKSCGWPNFASSTNLTPALVLRFEERSFRNPLDAPTALNLATLGGVRGLNLRLLGSGDTAEESGLGWPRRDGAQDVLGVESSSDPKLRKSLRSGDGSAVSMACPPLSGVSRYRRIWCLSFGTSGPRMVLTDDASECREAFLSGMRGGDFALCS